MSYQRGPNGVTYVQLPEEPALLRKIHAATSHLEETLVELDKSAGRLQRWSLILAWSSLSVSVAALAVAIIK